LLVLGVFITSASERHWGANLHTMQTAAVNMIVLGEIVYLFNCRNIYASVLNRAGLLGSAPILLAVGAVLVLQVAFTYMPIMQKFFGTNAMNWVQWGWIALLALLVFFAIEIEKVVIRVGGWKKI
jgi:magnesium-transporting ATPase (P-type)